MSNIEMATRDIVVVGASAGGIEALMRLARGLPPDFPAAVAIAVHLASNSPEVLPGLLGRAGPLQASSAEDGERLVPGRILVARPDRHLVVENGRVRLAFGPRENNHRPAIDALFRSAARWHGAGTVGVVLTGNLVDGAAGLAEIRRNGGVTVVQDPADALFPSMPLAAIRSAEPHHVVPLQEMPALLTRLVREKVEPASPALKPAEEHVPVTCPGCGGPLARLNGSPVVFRCRIGHRFSTEALLSGRKDTLEASLWAAINALEENAILERIQSSELRRANEHQAAERLDRQADEKSGHAAELRRIVEASS